MHIIIQDFLSLDSIKWKAVIVDECQQPKVSSQFSQIKMLAADVKILLYSGLLKVQPVSLFLLCFNIYL